MTQFTVNGKLYEQKRESATEVWGALVVEGRPRKGRPSRFQKHEVTYTEPKIDAVAPEVTETKPEEVTPAVVELTE